MNFEKNSKWFLYKIFSINCLPVLTYSKNNQFLESRGSLARP